MFTSNKIELSVWGNRESVKASQAKGIKKMTRKNVKVFCNKCLMPFTRQQFKHHKRTVCIGARGEMP